MAFIQAAARGRLPLQFRELDTRLVHRVQLAPAGRAPFPAAPLRARRAASTSPARLAVMRCTSLSICRSICATRDCAAGHCRMRGPVGLAQRRGLAGGFGKLRPQPLDQRRRQHLARRGVTSGALQHVARLREDRFLLRPFVGRRQQLAVDRAQPLRGQVAVDHRLEVVLLLELGGRLLVGANLPLQGLDPPAQPPDRPLRHLPLVGQLILDVHPGQGVDDPGSKHRIPRPVAKPDRIRTIVIENTEIIAESFDRLADQLVPALGRICCILKCRRRQPDPRQHGIKPGARRSPMPAKPCPSIPLPQPPP